MPRISLLQEQGMSPEQRQIHDAAAAGKRGRAPLQLAAWLHSPTFADRAQRLGEFVRYDTTLGPRLSETAILVVARHWTAHHEWSAHKREALRAGVSETTISAIANGARPEEAGEDEKLIYDFTRVLLCEHTIGDELFARAIGLLGEGGVVELVGVIGYYTLVAMTLNAFEIESGERELKEISNVK